MLEYAANGHYYWSKEEIRGYAGQSAKTNGLSLDEELKRLQPEKTETVDDFFQHVQENLREGQVRLIFFMEESPPELKSLVDFLNKQMERAEVLLVEARQHEYDGNKIVAPTLFGYTEEARQVKRVISVQKGQNRQWDKESFFVDASNRLNKVQYGAVKKVFDKSQELDCEFNWGTGKRSGSFNPKWSGFSKLAIYTVWSDGSIMFNLGSFKNDSKKSEFVQFVASELQNRLNLNVPEDFQRRWPNYKIDKWCEKVDLLLELLEVMSQRFLLKTKR
ncbi:hypothetical protein Thiowin_03991 [Thiorhodovibrio winogradskyi]|uniref:Uncharacterized protein n=2 Tax=Thiorhodovibrio winogradskyi TaxID=77007 RepID=A0ABZ0SEW4_9GAMM